MKKIKVLHLASIDLDKSKGTSSIIPEYFEEQTKSENFDVYFINCNEINLNYNNENFMFSSNSNIIKTLIREITPDIIIFHEVYKYIYIKIYRFILKNNIPYIIIPHGSLTKFAQGNKKIKKHIGNLFFFNNFISNSTKIQFLSENERNNSKGFNNKSLVIGNGFKINFEKNEYYDYHKNDTESKNFNLIYVGRYDFEIKGLDQLIKSFVLIKNNNIKDIKLTLYGKGTQENIKKIQELVKNNKLEEYVEINGPVYGNEKKDKVISSDMFIQVSRSEAHPLGVIEALSLGVPCILSFGTGINVYTEKNSIGYITKTEDKEIFETILKAYYNKKKLLDISINCYDFACDKFSWVKVLENTTKKYKEILGVK